MPKAITNTYNVVRLVDVSGALIPDSDWLATNDVEAAKAAGIFQVLPKKSGTMHIQITFFDDLNNAIAPGNATLNIELIEVLGAPGVPPALHLLGSTRNIAAGSIFVIPDAFPMKSAIAIRITGSSSLPIANTMAILVRVD
jgi:hypothetical protein